MGSSCHLSFPCLQLCLLTFLTLSALAACYKSTSFISHFLFHFPPYSVLNLRLSPKATIDSHSLGVFPSSCKYHPYYFQTMECGSVIDLGLRLRTTQHETYHTSVQSLGGYKEVTDELQSSCSSFMRKSHETRNGKCGKEYWTNEGGRQKWGYVKVTMDGFVVGRKVCVLDHVEYSTLARQLEGMFGMQSESGLRLFETESEFSLVYRDKEGSWRNAGDVPWKEFVENVERLRITRKKRFSTSLVSSKTLMLLSNSSLFPSQLLSGSDF